MFALVFAANMVIRDHGFLNDCFGSTSDIFANKFILNTMSAMCRLLIVTNNSFRATQRINRQDKSAQPTMQQKAKGRCNISPVLLPLDEGDGI